MLASLVHRVTVHGAGSLNPSVNPTLSFMANFPPCLQSAHIPKPKDPVSTEELLELLPHTGTLGGMTNFYYTFAYTEAYTPLVPAGGINLDPWFAPSQTLCNDALFAYRQRVRGFIDEYVSDWNKALWRLRGQKPQAPPEYALHQYQQWARSIEI